ncbi:MAG: hypothetical protein ACFFD8_00915 [Candidatus Thorarchaeota archaeon]
MGDWRVTFKSSERILTDVLDKTGALMIRPRFINQLKSISKTQQTNFKVISPEGINKLPSSFVIVELVKQNKLKKPITGLFEYSYGALRLVAVDSQELANENGDQIIAFFEAPLQKKTPADIFIYETQ